jgi:hypothetical protein
MERTVNMTYTGHIEAGKVVLAGLIGKAEQLPAD